MTKYIRVTEVADILNVNPVTIHRLIQRGHFPGAIKIDPTRRNSPVQIPREEVEAYQRMQSQYQGNKAGN